MRRRGFDDTSNGIARNGEQNIEIVQGARLQNEKRKKLRVHGKRTEESRHRDDGENVLIETVPETHHISAVTLPKRRREQPEGRYRTEEERRDTARDI